MPLAPFVSACLRVRRPCSGAILPWAWLGLFLCASVLTGRPAWADDDNDPPADLRVVPTKHYELHTDIPDAELVADLGKRLDVMYGLYAKELSEFKPAADAPPLPVYLFAERQRYMAFTHYAGTNTAGLFAGGGKHSYLASYLGGQGRDSLRRTLQHEAFHQFAYFTVSRHLPIWLNEGLAQVFEEGIWTGKDFVLGQVPPRRIRQLRADIQGHTLVPFDKFLTITPKQWSDNLHADADAGATYYNEAWAVAHFLTHSTNRDYRKREGDLLRKLHALDAKATDEQAYDPAKADAGADAAFAACFPSVPKFQAAFEAWARTMRATDEATLIERQETLGDLLIAYKDKGQSFDTVPEFRQKVVTQKVQMTYTRGVVKYETDPDPSVYFADLRGGVYPPRLLYFQPAERAPLPDIVCWPAPGFRVRTHFYAGDKGKIEHEVSIEPVGGHAAPVAHPAAH